MTLTYFPKNIYFDSNIGLSNVLIVYETGAQQVKATLPSVESLITVGEGLYFEYSSPTTDYIFWFNVDSANTAPAVVGPTIVEVAINSTDSQVQLATTLSAQIDAQADLSSVVSADNVLILNDSNGAALNPPNGVNSGVTLNIIQEGSIESTEYYVEPQYLDRIDIDALEQAELNTGLTFPMPFAIVSDHVLTAHPVNNQSAYETVRGKMRPVLSKPEVVFFHRTSSGTYWDGTNEVRLIDDQPI